jgi:hypothetical protein
MAIFVPSAEDWSANEILAHLRACANVWGKSISLMLVQDHPTLRHISPRGYIKKTNYLSLEFQPSLEVFKAQRQELLQALNGLDAAQWRRGATFTGTTLGREQTIFSQAQRIASHELVHCAQIEQLLVQT